MLLREYLKVVDIEAFAAACGVAVTTALNWRSGEKVPRPSICPRIEEVTFGAVTAAEARPDVFASYRRVPGTMPTRPRPAAPCAETSAAAGLA